MLLQFIAAAMSGPLGATNVVAFEDQESLGYNGNSAGVTFNSNGSLALYYAGVPIVVGYWLTPQSNMSAYEIRATLDSGDTPDGTLGSWLNLGSNQQWTLTPGGAPDTVSCTLTIEVRWTGNNVVQDSASFTLTATTDAEP